MGSVLLSNLNLNMGNNTFTATSDFQVSPQLANQFMMWSLICCPSQPNASPPGLQTLNNFVAGRDTDINISGYDGSTEVDSLTQAFNTLNLSVTLPGLKSKLLQGASLEGKTKEMTILESSRV